MITLLFKLYLNLVFYNRIKIGKGVRIHPSSTFRIDHTSKIVINSNTVVRKFCEFRASNNSRIIIGVDNIIDNGVRIISTNSSLVDTANNVKIGFYSVLNGGGGIKIMEYTSLYGFVYLQSSFHLDKGQYVKELSSSVQYLHKPIIIGKYCLIGAHSTVLMGSIIADYSKVEFNSIINN